MNILFLTHRLPYAPNRGDRIRAYHLLREMSRFADVSLLSLVHDDEEEANLGRVPFAADVAGLRVPWMRNQLKGLVSLPSSQPLTHSLLDAPGLRQALSRLMQSRRPDVALAYCSGMARLALEPPLYTVPFVLDMVDVDSAKWARLAGSTSGVRRWVYRREARLLRQFEARAVRAAATTLVVNDREREALLTIAPGAPVEIVSIGIDVDAFAPRVPPGPSADVVFCGMMNYAPNVDGVRWFAAEMWPRVRAARPDARLLIVGAAPTRSVRALASADPSIEVTGRVEDVQPYLWRSAVSVAPLRMTQGLQNKVLEALAAGVPVVATPGVAAGLAGEVLKGCVIADDPAGFASAVLALLAASPEERRRRAASVNMDRLSWSSQLQPLESILRQAAAQHRRGV